MPLDCSCEDKEESGNTTLDAGYFEKTNGFGVLSTADRCGKVNAAVYARPHMLEPGVAAFIMAENRTYQNLKETSSAVYLFKQDGPGYNGVRLYLKKLKESNDQALILSLCRRQHHHGEKCEGSLHLVYFTIIAQRALVGK